MSQLRKEGTDWFAVFNLASPAVTSNSPPDLDLVHSMRHESVVSCLGFSPDGNYLATGCNHTTQVYNIVTGERVCVLTDHSVPRSTNLYIRCLSFSPDGRYLATGAEDGNIRIWSTHTCTLHRRLSGHTSEIYALEYSHDGRLLVSASGDATVRVWNTDDVHSDAIPHGAVRVFLIEIGVPAVHDATDRGITSLAISPNGTLIAAASLDTLIRIWDVESRALVARLAGHTRSVYSVAWGADGADLISGALDGTVKRWDVSPLYYPGRERTCSCTHTYLGHEDYVLCVSLTHDPGLATPQQWAVSASKDRTVKFWAWDHADATRGSTPAASRRPELAFTLKGHTNSVIAVDASPAGGLFATAGGDWDARIWRYTNLR